MVHSLRRLLVPALIGWSFAAAPAAAQNRTEFVLDEANLFSKDAKAKANAEIAQIVSQFKKELVVDTVYSVKVPEGKDKTEFFNDWAEKRAAREKVNGVYVVIIVDPPMIRVELGNRTKTSGLFDEPDRKELRDQVIANLKATRADPNDQGKKDHVLLAATKFVHDRMSHHRQIVSGGGAQRAPAAHAGETPLVTYIVIAIVVLLAFWLIRGILRGLSGGGVGGPGMAGGGYGGGGGGGFFSSMLGGLFGAAAGMWMYNNFFGGHSNSAWGAGPDGGSGPNAGNDADTSYSGDGGDYSDTGGGGGDAGGGDAGGGDAGGGDWGAGGGGDFGGGGGDFGGGGGDFGGGGGGDW